jgi:hypothetical protein
MNKTPKIKEATLSERIESLNLNYKGDPEQNLPRRLRSAINRFRWHLCGLFGVSSETVTDLHVAQFALRVVRNFSYMYEHFNGIGIEVKNQLAGWSRAILLDQHP